MTAVDTPRPIRVPGSIGIPVRGVQLQVIDDQGDAVTDGSIGEIVIRGANVMKGYWNKPEQTRKPSPTAGSHRRSRPGRPGRQLLHRRPQEGHDHSRWLQRVRVPP